jgi:hypothetical protein
MILDCVVSTTFEDFGDLSPLISVVPVHQVQYPFFLATPSNLLDLWVEMIVPALTALLSYSARKVFCDQGPLLWSIFVNKV